LLTETVTPLKPLEAMAFGRLVIASDVQGLIEVSGGERNAVFCAADDVDSLARTLATVAADPARHAAIADAGRRYVVSERGWTGIAKRYDEVYAAR
jgi:glycogen(starch) synthase